MIEDTFEGKTFSCTHENTNESGICDKCLGKDTNTLREEFAEWVLKEERSLGEITTYWLNKLNQKLEEIEDEISNLPRIEEPVAFEVLVLQIIKNKKI